NPWKRITHSASSRRGEGTTSHPALLWTPLARRLPSPFKSVAQTPQSDRPAKYNPADLSPQNPLRKTRNPTRRFHRQREHDRLANRIKRRQQPDDDDNDPHEQIVGAMRMRLESPGLRVQPPSRRSMLHLLRHPPTLRRIQHRITNILRLQRIPERRMTR